MENIIAAIILKEIEFTMLIILLVPKPLTGGGIGSYTGLYAVNVNDERNKSKMCTEINNEDFRVRKLTPKECWRLMGFDDEDFYKAEAVCSNTQLYKQAGNSIVVNVLEHIYRELAKHNDHFTDGISVLSLFSGIGAFEKAMDRYDNKENKYHDKHCSDNL